MIITRQSFYSGKIRMMDLDITEEELRNYNQGTLVQNAFPRLTVDEREFFISGLTSEEWEEFCKQMNEEYD